MHMTGNFGPTLPLKCCICVCVRERERGEREDREKRENSDFNQRLFTSQETLASIRRYFGLSHLGGGGVRASS